MTPIFPIAAGIGIEELVWLVILIIWGIAQTVQKARENRRAPTRPPPPSRPATPMDDELREFLEQLSGRSSSATTVLEEELEEDVEPVETPPRPAPAPRPPPPPVRPVPQFELVRTVAQPPIPPIRHARMEDDYPSIPTIPATAVDESAGRALLRSALNAPGVSMRMKALNFKGMSKLLSFNPSATRGAPLLSARDLRDKRTLRRAFLAKVILDPPRAFAPYDRAL